MYGDRAREHASVEDDDALQPFGQAAGPVAGQAARLGQEMRQRA